jgi:hypothetical protein
MAAVGAATLLLFAVLGADGAAQVCRPNALGTISCPVERPKQRPPEGHVRGLDEVIDDARGDVRDPGFIPGRRTNSFGQTNPGAGGAVSPRCRTDNLGNVRC